MRNEALAAVMRDYLSHFIGTWYSWGGDDPAAFDCSGLAIEGLTAVGKFPRGRDTTAQGLYDEGWRKVAAPAPGCLAFRGAPDAVEHVEVIWRIVAGRAYTIGASGGTSRTKTREDAIRDNAFVKVRPLAPSMTAFVDPFRERLDP